MHIKCTFFFNTHTNYYYWLLSAASSFLLLLMLLLLILYYNSVSASPGIPWCWSTEHLIIYRLHHVRDELIYILVKLGRGLKVRHLVLLSEGTGIFERHCSIIEIYFVANEGFNDVGISMLVDALEPVLHVIEGGHVCHIKGNYYTVSLLVETVSDCAETLLTCGVPNLHCNIFVLGALVSWGNIVKANCCHVRGSELLVLVPTHR